MIEVPRGALRAGDLAKTAEFFSFGTNDLTQMVSGRRQDWSYSSSSTALAYELICSSRQLQQQAADSEK